MKNECKNCYGKGYSTEMIGNTIAHADFIGDKTYMMEKAHIIIRYCKCDRGEQLRKYFSVKKKYRGWNKKYYEQTE